LVDSQFELLQPHISIGPKIAHSSNPPCDKQEHQILPTACCQQATGACVVRDKRNKYIVVKTSNPPASTGDSEALNSSKLTLSASTCCLHFIQRYLALLYQTKLSGDPIGKSSVGGIDTSGKTSLRNRYLAVIADAAPPAAGKLNANFCCILYRSAWRFPA
jgi:hypothetical protein